MDREPATGDRNVERGRKGCIEPALARDAADVGGVCFSEDGHEWVDTPLPGFTLLIDFPGQEI